MPAPTPSLLARKEPKLLPVAYRKNMAVVTATSAKKRAPCMSSASQSARISFRPTNAVMKQISLNSCAVRLVRAYVDGEHCAQLGAECLAKGISDVDFVGTRLFKNYVG